MTDEEKLEFSVEAFKDRLDRIETWDAFKQTIGNISPGVVNNFLKNRLAEQRDSYYSGAAANTNAGDELDDLVGEYDGI